jgi:hypothetical protein
MTCPLCVAYRKQYPLNKEGIHEIADGYTSEPIECAFEYGHEFSTDNWNCQTMIALRGLTKADDGRAGKGTWLFHEDSRYALLPIHNSSATMAIQDGVLTMSWYKRRGRTGRAIVICDDEPPQVLTLGTAIHILETYEKREKKCDS